MSRVELSLSGNVDDQRVIGNQEATVVVWRLQHVQRWRRCWLLGSGRSTDVY